MPKHRPIIGHESQQKDLLADIAHDNIDHAYLFSGPRHIGKFAMAHWFAGKLLCGQKPDKQCMHQLENLTHPDLLVLDKLWMEGVNEDWDTLAEHSNVPQLHRSKAPKAKTDVISIDDIRALQERLHETSLGQYRCCLIRSVERMQDAAANAFLKILEEPPAGLVFILTTQSQSSLLPTIRSRSRIIRFRHLPQKEILSLLTDSDDADKQFIATVAGGAPGAALTLQGDPDAMRAHKLLRGQAQTFWRPGTSLHDRLQILAPLKERGKDADRLLLHLGLALKGNEKVTEHSQVYHELLQGYQTNAHRQLLAQKFAASVS